MSITIAMPRMSADPELTTAQSKYVESLARAGASVRWVELADPDKAVAEALECAGLLLPGGGDIEPSLFGQERIPACGEPNPLRDAAEPKLLHAFLAAGKPILGICRGIQVLNAFLGGELYQDIKPLEHVPHNDHWAKIHTVTVRRGTLLAEILKQDTVLVNSQHHQAASGGSGAGNCRPQRGRFHRGAGKAGRNVLPRGSVAPGVAQRGRPPPAGPV